MKKEMLIKGAAIAVIGGLFVKNIIAICRDEAKRDVMEAEYEDLGYEEVEIDE